MSDQNHDNDNDGHGNDGNNDGPMINTSSTHENLTDSFIMVGGTSSQPSSPTHASSAPSPVPFIIVQPAAVAAATQPATSADNGQQSTPQTTSTPSSSAAVAPSTPERSHRNEPVPSPLLNPKSLSLVIESPVPTRARPLSITTSLSAEPLTLSANVASAVAIAAAPYATNEHKVPVNPSDIALTIAHGHAPGRIYHVTIPATASISHIRDSLEAQGLARQHQGQLFAGNLQLDDHHPITVYPTIITGVALQLTDPLLPLASPVASHISPFSPRATDNEAKIFRATHPETAAIELGTIQPSQPIGELPPSVTVNDPPVAAKPVSSAPSKTATGGPRVNTHPHALRREEFGSTTLVCSLCRSSLKSAASYLCNEQQLGTPPPCDFAVCDKCYQDWRSDKDNPQPSSAPRIKKCPVSATTCKALWILLFIADFALFTGFCASLWDNYTDVTDDCHVLTTPPQCRAYNTSASVSADATSSRLLLIGDNSICGWQGHKCRSRAYGLVILSALVWCMTFVFFCIRSFLVVFFRPTPAETHSPLLKWTWPAALGCMIVTLWALSIPSFSGVPPVGLTAITFVSAFFSFFAPFIQVCFEGTCFCAPSAGRKTFSQVAIPLTALLLQMALWLAFCSQLWINWNKISELCDALDVESECKIAKWESNAAGDACSWQSDNCRPRIYAVGVWAAITFIVELIFAIARVGLFAKHAAKPESDDGNKTFILHWTLLCPGGVMIWICSMWALGTDYSGVPVTPGGLCVILVGLLVVIPIIWTWASHRRWYLPSPDDNVRDRQPTRSSRAVSEAAIAARTSRASRPMDSASSSDHSAGGATGATGATGAVRVAEII